jgi:hypothetical protein
MEDGVENPAIPELGKDQNERSFSFCQWPDIDIPGVEIELKIDGGTRPTEDGFCIHLHLERNRMKRSA